MAGRPLIRTKGPKEGQCNICGAAGALTEDHSPPKLCVRPTAVQVRHIITMLASKDIQEKGRISQNGLKFRTLCARCNNKVLGRWYDPALAEFTNSASVILSSCLTLPRVIAVPGRPQLIMRAVWGHLAAQGVDRYLKGPETDTFRDWFLDKSSPLPEKVRFYYWSFPHQGCVLFRDAAYLHIPSGRVAAIWLMKFFPISFLIAFEKDENPMFALPSLSEWSDRSPDEQVELPLHLTGIPNRYWPEAPTKQSMVVYGQEAMFTVPHVAGARGRG